MTIVSDAERLERTDVIGLILPNSGLRLDIGVYPKYKNILPDQFVDPYGDGDYDRAIRSPRDDGRYELWCIRIGTDNRDAVAHIFRKMDNWEEQVLSCYADGEYVGMVDKDHDILWYIKNTEYGELKFFNQHGEEEYLY